ncbi:hypothetical protein [Quadrisphaera setariae]|uniref:Transcriptional regulator, AbiEi antitoxin, Type IV TA system n=1 Tax=Quadrisphaera setariae TaxID=2593304 RepID=A0A5C8ZEK3_9ACTN|nr:hypothetical protein [Quadrisphaera setariae]TXR55346.1 hypothetical protein FMM08_15920 [Quadrisphaera setariae]
MPPRSRVPAALEQLGGIASWTRLTGETSHSAVVRAVTSGAVVRVLPGVLALPDRADSPGGRSLAALVFAGAPAALSHTTALDLHGLPVPAEVLRAAVHVSVPHHRRRTVPTGSSWRVELHRCRSDAARVLRGGLEVVTAARAVVDSWPLLSGSDQRAPALVGVRRRLVTPTGLDDALSARRQAGGVSELRRLVAAIRAGCRSELELWGYERVFTGPAFAGLHRQVEVRVDGRTSVLDCYDEAAALALELDGRAGVPRLPAGPGARRRARRPPGEGRHPDGEVLAPATHAGTGGVPPRGAGRRGAASLAARASGAAGRGRGAGRR